MAKDGTFLNLAGGILKATGIQGETPVVIVEGPVEPVCQYADTLCQLNEYAKENGYNLPEYVKEKTGYDVVPTHLPEFAQNFLKGVESYSYGYITPANASIGIVAISSIVGSVTGMYTAYKFGQWLMQEPAHIRETIGTNTDMATFFYSLPKATQKALRKADKDDAATILSNYNNHVGQQFAKADVGKQASTLNSVVSKNAEIRKQAETKKASLTS